jgi:hypothetical protein
MINTIYMEHSVSQPDKSLLQILVPLREEEIKRKIQWRKVKILKNYLLQCLSSLHYQFLSQLPDFQLILLLRLHCFISMMFMKSIPLVEEPREATSVFVYKQLKLFTCHKPPGLQVLIMLVLRKRADKLINNSLSPLKLQCHSFISFFLI